MTAKEQKIKEAYGEYWVECKNYINTDGWIEVGTFNNNEPIDFEIFEIELDSEFEDVPFGRFTEVRECVRPKSLQGIENNNGWIRIESEEDLPESGYYEVIVRDSGKITRATLDNEKSSCKYYSHYQPILKLEPPIY